MTDLDRLIEAVERGEAHEVQIFSKRIAPTFKDKGKYWPSHDIGRAFNGSLDAAKSLHDALLPGWDVRITDHGTQDEDVGRWHVKVNWQHMDWQPTFSAPGLFGFSAQENNPARSWLIAILKAYRNINA